MTRRSPAAIVVAMIALYQATLSPDTGWFSLRHPYGFCRYYPTCSSYAAESIRQHGLIRGFLRAARRIGRCTPWHQGGYDPVR
ncbi:MAG: membrane protein insertion efficiency factor YidD [Candidatus Kerfeldbacteria bacterium]|nr:membrane protein insertion efficiency factor YidD [Candidatus Kerfeldbacteria bacterium]